MQNCKSIAHWTNTEKKVQNNIFQTENWIWQINIWLHFERTNRLIPMKMQIVSNGSSLAYAQQMELRGTFMNRTLANGSHLDTKSQNACHRFLFILFCIFFVAVVLLVVVVSKPKIQLVHDNLQFWQQPLERAIQFRNISFENSCQLLFWAILRLW